MKFSTTYKIYKILKSIGQFIEKHIPIWPLLLILVLTLLYILIDKWL